jgi:hypothetical protein
MHPFSDEEVEAAREQLLADSDHEATLLGIGRDVVGNLEHAHAVLGQFLANVPRSAEPGVARSMTGYWMQFLDHLSAADQAFLDLTAVASAILDDNKEA